jgi:hypothetical protein
LKPEARNALNVAAPIPIKKAAFGIATNASMNGDLMPISVGQAYTIYFIET